MYRFVQRLTPERAQAVATHLYIDMLKHGYTAVGEFHYVHDGSADMLMSHLAAAKETGIAITLLPSMYRWSNFGQKALQARQKRFDSNPAFVLRLFEQMQRQAGPDVRVGASPHSLRAVDPGSLKELVAGLPVDTPIHVHAAEQTKEVEECVAALGKRPVEWLLENFKVDRRWCLVHATHMTPDETKALANSGATAGLCPTTEANLGDGIFPLLAYRAAGGRYGIGGDSHVSRDPAEELRLLEYAQRLATRRRNIITGERTPAVGTTLWLEAAAGGAALGRKMGAIAPGMRADLVVLDADHADLTGRSGGAIANALIFSGATGLVRDVMVGGAWTVRQGSHPQEESARASYKHAVAELHN
jgi:formimidoylglutamate deiminase